MSVVTIDHWILKLSYLILQKKTNDTMEKNHHQVAIEIYAYSYKTKY